MKQESPSPFLLPDFASSMPTAGREGLEGLSKDEIRAWALRKSEEYRLLSYDMLSLHNAAALIHTLPVELLMKIFGMTWFMHDSKCRQGFHLTSVCRKWRTVYLSTPAFWAQAVSNLQFHEHDGRTYWKIGYYSYRDGHSIAGYIQPSQEVVNMLLARSAHHPVVMCVEQTLAGLVADPSLPACVLPPAVFPYLSHVVDFHVKTTLYHLHELYQVLSMGMPALENLDIRASEKEPPDLARMLASLPLVPDDSLPRLRILSVDPAIFFPLIAVRSLEKVYLDSFQDMTVGWEVPWPHPAWSESRSLIRALSRCRKLEYLHLEYYTRSRWWPPLGGGQPGAVQLPYLKHLAFGEEIPELCAHVALAALDPCIPSTASVNRGDLVPGQPDHLSEIFPAYLVQHHPFDTVILSAPENKPYSRGWAVHCLADGSRRLDGWFRTNKMLADLGIQDVFQTAQVTHLEIIPDREPNAFRSAFGDSDFAEDWAGVLLAFPHLTHLTVCGVTTPSAVVDALGADVPGCPLCPALRYVTFCWEVPREIGPKKTVRACDAATYVQHQDVGPRVERRCSPMQLAFERRASMKAQSLHALEFYEYESQGFGEEIDDEAPTLDELIAESRRDDRDLPCLERLRAVVGGPVVYRGYLLKVVDYRRAI